MSTIAPEDVVRVQPPYGPLAWLLRNRDKVASDSPGKLIANDLTVVSGRGIARQWTLVAGLPVDHGTVADESAMLALHVDSAETPYPRWVVPGDSCLRTDDPGWRWHCLRGHGTQLSDWERRPLGGALEGLVSGKADTDHDHAISDVGGLSAALSGKQATLANAAALSRITASDILPLWDGGEWPGGGGGGSLPAVRLRRTTSQSISSDGAIEWSEIETGAAALWSSGTPTRLLAPAAGLYRAMVWLRQSGPSAVYFTRNGAGAHAWRAVQNGGETELWSVDAVLSAGDHMEVRVYGGGTISAVGDNSPLCTWQRVI